MLETFEILENGEIKISENVIAVITTVAALGVDGVTKMNGTLTADIGEKLGIRTSEGKGVKVEFLNGALKIELQIFVEYGRKVVDVAKAVQLAVKESVTMMTEMQIQGIYVTVQGVSLDKNTQGVGLFSKK